MNPTMAKLSAALSVFLIAAGAITLWVTSHPGPGATTVNAEFEDAFPILAGMNVRVSGAIAGSVREVQLTDQGTAMVTLSLNAGTEPPRDDASAAIRQQDVTGDSYVSLSPGTSPEPLGDTTIPTSRTLVAPRFDDLLNSFAQPEREALKTILIQTGAALDRNGENLNQAVLSLRPALGAADRALTEVRTQNHALSRLVADASNVTGQAAQRSSELGHMIGSLDETLRTTADHGPGLDQALAHLPQTARAARTTLTELEHTSDAATPLARALDRGAPQLAQSLRLGAPFLGDAHRALHNVNPTLSEAAATLGQARSTILAAPNHVATAPFELAGNLDELLRTLLGNEDVLKSLFGADSYGQAPGNADDVGFGAFAVENGLQAGYSGNDPQRGFARAMVVPSCEVFGLKIAPACLSDAMAMFSADGRRSARHALAAGAGDQVTPAAPAPPTDAAGSPPAAGSSPVAGNGTGPGSAAPGNAAPANAAKPLLDFLFGGGQ